MGAQSVDDDKYAGKEEIIKITDDEEEVLSDESEQEETIEEEITEETTEEENREETVSDILDELFNMEEDFIEQEPIKEKPVMTAPIQVSESGDLEIIEENIALEDSDKADPAATVVLPDIGSKTEEKNICSDEEMYRLFNEDDED